MKEKVLIPTRGVIALDIINSLNSMGMETLLMHSPEDSLSLPVKLADRSFKFYSSRLEDSYLDGEAILEKAREVRADYIHPGYGFLAENPGVRQALPREQHPLHRPRRRRARRRGGQDQAPRDRRRPRPAGPEILRPDQEPPGFRGLRRRAAITRSSSSR